jgi:hypothetical protein
MSARTIRITAGEVTATATLDGSRTADAIWTALPIEAKASTWGDEIYFDIAAGQRLLPLLRTHAGEHRRRAARGERRERVRARDRGPHRLQEGAGGHESEARADRYQKGVSR